jgi:hypothetical protein
MPKLQGGRTRVSIDGAHDTVLQKLNEMPHMQRSGPQEQEETTSGKVAQPRGKSQAKVMNIYRVFKSKSWQTMKNKQVYISTTA